MPGKEGFCVVIAGGRDYHLTDWDRAYLDKLHAKSRIEHVISGCCRGADQDGAAWARTKVGGPSVWEFPADWQRHGKRAGPLRNEKMASHADLVILFPGGRGTLSMALAAKAAGVRVLYPHGAPKAPEQPQPYEDPDE